MSGRADSKHQSTESNRESPPRRDNQVLGLLPDAAFQALNPHLEVVDLHAGQTIFEPGDEISHAYFPLGGAVLALVLAMRDGHAVEAATIGREGVIGAGITLGKAPAFARTVVQMPGLAARAPVTRFEAVKDASAETRDILNRYADCLTAQALQSVGCASVHTLQARCARWLLTMQDRSGGFELHVTHEDLAEMLGVARTYLTRVISRLQSSGVISYRRGVVRIENRPALKANSCECYGSVRKHYDRVLPGLYPSRSQ